MRNARAALDALVRSVFPVVVLSLANACATGGALSKHAASIASGDTRASVIQRLGLPGDRQFQGDNEALQYCSANLLGGSTQYTVVWLYGGRVTALTTYPGDPARTCRGGYQTVRWEDAPKRP